MASPYFQMLRLAGTSGYQAMTKNAPKPKPNEARHGGTKFCNFSISESFAL